MTFILKFNLCPLISNQLLCYFLAVHAHKATARRHIHLSRNLLGKLACWPLVAKSKNSQLLKMSTSNELPNWNKILSVFDNAGKRHILPVSVLMRVKSLVQENRDLFASQIVKDSLRVSSRAVSGMEAAGESHDADHDDKDEKPVKPQKDDNDEKLVKLQKDDNDEKLVKPQKDDNDEKPVKPQKDDNDEKHVKPQKDDKLVKPPKDDKEEKLVKPQKDDNDEKLVKPQKDDNDEKLVKPQKEEGVEGKQKSKKKSQQKKGPSAETGDEDRKPKNIKPNYFVAVQITNPEIHAVAKKIQKGIQETTTAKLRRAFIAAEKFHITLMVMHLANEEETKKAAESLEKCVPLILERASGQPITLEFEGLSTFNGGRVLFASLKATEGLEHLQYMADEVTAQMKNNGIVSTDKPGKILHPHLTLMKFDGDRELLRQGVRRVEASQYEPYVDEVFGGQIISGLQLCSMHKTRADGYYFVEHEVFFNQ